MFDGFNGAKHFFKDIVKSKKLNKSLATTFDLFATRNLTTVTTLHEELRTVWPEKKIQNRNFKDLKLQS